MQLLAIATVLLTVGAGRSMNPSSFDNTKFDVCKGPSPLNSLESMKAQTLAAKMGARCTGQPIAQFISKNKVPLFALTHIGNKLCEGVIITYAYFGGNDLSLPKGTSFKDTMNVVETLIGGWRNINWTIRERKTKRSYTVPSEEMITTILDTMTCVHKMEKGVPTKDGRLMLYCLNNLRRMLSKA